MFRLEMLARPPILPIPLTPLQKPPPDEVFPSKEAAKVFEAAAKLQKDKGELAGHCHPASQQQGAAARRGGWAGPLHFR